MKKILSLNNFLAQKPLYYDFIDNNRIKYAYNILKTHIRKLPYIIHIVGTNGKGTTGRFLAHYLYKINLKVLHYSSPHILKFNERIWINGSNIDDNSLEITHQKLQNILSYDMLDNLTYFEYTTLLALILSSSLDYLILEAGLGGEFDATNVVKNDLSLITPIYFDHQDHLLVLIALNKQPPDFLVGRSNRRNDKHRPNHMPLHFPVFQIHPSQ